MFRNITWKRAKEVFKDNFELFKDSVTPNDII